MKAEPDGKVENDARDRCRNRRQGTGQRGVGAQPLDIGRAEEDRQKSWDEGDPGRKRRAKQAGRQRIDADRRCASGPGSSMQ
ncbi:hypothetical protein EFR01_32490 [Sinorhizobium fredii]|nr:hypothetical protein EFR01_32490 [Sinorhizobium fredii]GLS11539.1 hypothetical protein GCM10007864_51700 [Sinorhizobium fredii]